jgi:glycolate dehydrogenase FAD-binding subunit
LPSVSEIRSVHEGAEVLSGAADRGEHVSIERPGGEVEISTRRLDQVLEHEAGDLTAIVEAGIRVVELNARLEAAGQMLALDPPGNPTIGACIAANLSGPRRHRYGTARDLVIGVTVVLADGTIASSGGKVVKNVAGYDLGKLFCGSEGRLGLIARVALKLHPRPEVVRTLAVPVESAEDAAAKALAILRAPLAPSAVDVLWPGRLAVLFEGSRRGVDEQFARAQALVGGLEDFGSVWEDAEARQTSARGRLRFSPGKLAQTLAGLDEAVVRVAAGVAYVPGEVGDPRDPGEIALAERVRAQFDPAGVLV